MNIPTTRLKQWRMKQGLSTREVADLTGISFPMISLVENGKRRLSPRSKVMLSRRLHVPLADLFEVEPFLDMSELEEDHEGTSGQARH